MKRTGLKVKDALKLERQLFAQTKDNDDVLRYESVVYKKGGGMAYFRYFNVFFHVGILLNDNQVKEKKKDMEECYNNIYNFYNIKREYDFYNICTQEELMQFVRLLDEIRKK